HPHSTGDARVIYRRTRFAWQYYPAVLLFKLPPLTMLALPLVLVAAAHPRTRAAPPLRVALHLLVFAFVYVLVMTIAAKKTWRYMVVCSVLGEMAAGLGLAWLADRAWRRRARWALAAIAALVVVQIVAIGALRPHYIAFYSRLGGGRAVADQYLNL